MLTLTDLFTPLTEAQVFETFLATLETSGVPARSWRTGGVYRNILRIVARSYSGLTTVMSEFAKAGFLDSASGGWLTLLARYVYGVERRAATFATGRVLFTNIGGGVYTNAAGTVTVLWPGTKKAYVTTAALTLLTPGATQLVNVQAVEEGSASSAAPGLIDTLETQLLGVTVTNPLSVVGSDAQDDESLQQLCRDKLAALSLRGPRGAYGYAVGVAKRVDGTPVNINRYAATRNETTGVVTVHVASPSGAPVVDDLAAVADSIEVWARPDTVTAVVAAATPVAFARTLTVWAKSAAGVSAAGIAADVDAALVALVAAYEIGGLTKPPSAQGYLYATNIEGTAKGANRTIFAIDGVGADLPLNAGQVATLATTLNVRIV